MTKNAFAIIHTWPEIKNAEYEVLHRIIRAAENIDVSVIIIDNNGYPLWSSSSLAVDPTKIIDGDAVDFLISLHFESPKVIDAYSYYTVWQPLEFYHTFGYQKSIDKVTSHNDLLSADSDLADAHALNVLRGAGRTPTLPLLKMFHSFPEPFLEPAVTEKSTLFYAGINWERLGKPKGRFHDVLVALDKQGLTDIYGPEMFLGVAPWEGFETYRRELPFDGESIKSAINQSGICLALSSGPHKHAGIMSTRLFEGLAGGAAIIATPNALIDKHFKNIVYQVDDTQGDGVLSHQINSALRSIRANPEEARNKVREGQKILREVCSLENSLKVLMAETPKRIANFEETHLASANISVIFTFHGQSLTQFLEYVRDIARQRVVSIDLHVIADERFCSRYEREIKSSPNGAIQNVHVYAGRLDPTPQKFEGQTTARTRTGSIVARILKQISTPYFCFLRNGEILFRDHLASIIKAIGSTPNSQIGCSGMISQATAGNGKKSRAIQGSRLTDFDTILFVKGTNQPGRFVFKIELAKDSFEHLFAILDGEEYSYFQLAGFVAGPLAQSQYSTYVADDVCNALLPAPAEPVEHQRQYIRDRFSRDPRWLERISKSERTPEFIYAYGPGSPIRWENYVDPIGATHRLLANRMMKVGLGAEGQKFVGDGFSYPEEGHVWLEAQSGTISFVLDETINQDEELELVLHLAGRPSLQTGRDQHCTIAINGMIVGYKKVPEARTMMRFLVPLHIRAKFNMFRIEIKPDHSEMVYDADGKVVDSRRLGISLVEFGAFQGVDGQYPTLEPEISHKFGTNEPTQEIARQGFYQPENGFVWMAGTKGHLQFKVLEIPPDPTIVLSMAGRNSRKTKAAQKVRIFVNGNFHGEHSIPEQETAVEIIVPPDQIRVDSESKAGLINLRIEASHAEEVFNKFGAVVDGRHLGVQFRTIGIFSGGASATARRSIKEKLAHDRDNRRWWRIGSGASK